MQRLCGGILLTGLLLAASASSHVIAEEMYRWVDAEGKVHFGDRPPTGTQAQDISGELAPINSADGNVAGSNTAQSQPAGSRQARLEREYQSRQRQQQLERQQRLAKACREAQKQLRIIQGRVAFIDDNGREMVITERERQQRAQQLQREIARTCG